ncbi:MAG: NTP transferase domain-containing protein [Proteobacteria bacterium]|nr:NTP transferase domain-containing protein [Pseudomonadota bacterium]
MKAVVLAGGFGTRIQPLTSKVPKPMLPLMNRPILELILERLDGIGVEEISLLLYFMPERIRDHFENTWRGKASLRFIVPDGDYGTAGSIKFAEKGIDDTFLVMSGDLVTDFDLFPSLEFHKSRASLATIVLTSVTNPLQFGVVIADEKGRIKSFLEKPSWGEVVSDTINTGIYILEPEVFREIPEGKPFDFSKDLFPKLLKGGKPLFAHKAQGYWKDVGNPESYRSVHKDAFLGRVKIPFPGEAVKAGSGTVWLAEGAKVLKGARISGTVALGGGVRLPRGQYSDTIFGEGCRIAPGSRIESSVIWSGVTIGGRCNLKNAVICDKARLGDGVFIPEGAIIASDCILEDGVSVERDISLWPGKRVEEGSVLTSNLIWGDRWRASLFEGNVVSGQTNVEMSTVFTARLGEAYGSVLPEASRVLVSRDGHRASRMFKRAFLGGVLSTGVSAFDIRHNPLPLMRYKLTTFGEVGGVHFRQDPDDESKTQVLFYNGHGYPLPDETAKALERVFFREKFRRSHFSDVGTIYEMPLALEYYREGFVKKVSADLLKERGFSVVLDLAHGPTSSILPVLLTELGCDTVVLNAHTEDKKRSSSLSGIKASLTRVGRIVRTLKADMGFYISPSGERLYLVDDKGRPQPSHMVLLFVLELLARSGGRAKPKAFLPVQAPMIAAGKIDGLTLNSGRIARLSPETFRKNDLIASVNGEFAFTRFQPHWDAMFAVACILEMVARQEGQQVSKIFDGLPRTYYHFVTTVCPAEAKGKLMRNFREAFNGHELSFEDGVKVDLPEGWILLSPDLYGPTVSLYVEAGDRDSARRLFDPWRRRVRRWALER